MEPNCASYNFEIPTSQAGVHKCELNNSTHESNEDDLVNDQNFVYRGTKVSLGQGFGGWWEQGTPKCSEELARRLQPHVYMRPFLRTGPSF